MRQLGLVMVLACGGSPSPKRVPPGERITVEDPAPKEAAPKVEPPAPKGVELSIERPTQRELAWLIELVGQRRGISSAAELEGHFAARPLKPALIDGTIKWLADWGAEAKDAYVESVDVDQDEYLKATVVAGNKRWKVILNFESSTFRISYVQFGK
jgi:hypothetical protein